MATAERTGFNYVSVGLDLDEAKAVKDALSVVLATMPADDAGFWAVKEVFEELNRICP